ncbi:MAG TPA: ABC transporter substrate-binding protein [Solirubrobacteraceae bacterium]
MREHREIRRRGTARRLVLAALAVGAMTMLAGCLVPNNQITGKRGGTLSVLDTTYLDSIDPGQSYSDASYLVTYATQRPLYGFDPGRSKEGVIPDLAQGVPEITDRATRVDVHLRGGVHYSPPVNREVRAADVKYAIERAFTQSVENPYVHAYFSDIVGARQFAAGHAREISGIEVKGDLDLVFHLDRGTGRVLANALTLPVTAPVPQQYAEQFDRGARSTYGLHQVATGPYMVRTGTYVPGKQVELLRNPNWNRDTDFRPAFADRIVLHFELLDPGATATRILDGRGMLSGGFTPPAGVLHDATRDRPDQVVRPQAPGTQWVTLNTQVAPFDRVDVRRAVSAAIDREALRTISGGAEVGDLATHYIPPGIPGFDEGGGYAGPQLDFLSNPRGDLALAHRYLAKAGYPGGRYTGPAVTMVGYDHGRGRSIALAVRAQLTRLGIPVHLRVLDNGVADQAYCSVPATNVAVCPETSWGADFLDGQTILDPTFNGRNIRQRDNINQSQLDEPAINAAMARAELVTGQADRAGAWGAIDRSVASSAPAVPWLWSRTVALRSANVKGAIYPLTGGWDLAFCSLK